VLQALGPAPWLHLHGKFDRDQAAQVYAALDVVVLPAIYLEVFGLVVAEALSAGRPVLSTRCGGPEDQIEDGVNGWLITPNEPAPLSQQIQKADHRLHHWSMHGGAELQAWKKSFSITLMKLNKSMMFVE
jgi:glycosyltransferase involved in cell wall biosynthesis